jgi:acetyl esterase/lipase
MSPESTAAASVDANEPRDYIPYATLGMRAAAAYATDGQRRAPTCSPHRAPLAQLARLPPTLLLYGGAEPLHDQQQAFAARVASAGVPVDLHVGPRMEHVRQARVELAIA